MYIEMDRAVTARRGTDRERNDRNVELEAAEKGMSTAEALYSGSILSPEGQY